MALILSADESLLTDVKSLLPNGRYHLGASLTAGYGHVTLQSGSPTTWNGNQNEEAPTASGSP